MKSQKMPEGRAAPRGQYLSLSHTTQPHPPHTVALAAPGSAPAPSLCRGRESPLSSAAKNLFLFHNFVLETDRSTLNPPRSGNQGLRKGRKLGEQRRIPGSVSPLKLKCGASASSSVGFSSASVSLTLQFLL